MNMNRALVFLVCVCTIAVVVLTGGVAGSSFGLSVDSSVETPERTISHDVIGEHTVSAVGVGEPDSEFIVSVTAPTDGTHFLDLYKGEDRVDTFRIDDGDETIIIDTDQFDPGSYMLRLQSDGNTENVFPVVINGYDIDVETAENTSNDELTVSATVIPTASNGQPHAVETVVWNDDNNERETLSSTGGDEYEGTVSLSAFDDDSYNVYVAALSDETVYDDRNEILAIDDSVVEDTDSDDDTSGDNGSGDETTDTGSDNGTDETDDTNDAETGDDDTEETDEADDMDDTDDEVDDTNETDNGENETTGDESVIQPNTGSDDSTTDGNKDEQADDTAGENLTDDETPLSPVVAIIALVAVALLAARRRSIHKHAPSSVHSQ